MYECASVCIHVCLYLPMSVSLHLLLTLSLHLASVFETSRNNRNSLSNTKMKKFLSVLSRCTSSMHLFPGLVDRASTSNAEHLWFELQSSHASESKTGILLATLLHVLWSGVSARTGWPRVSVLRLGEVAYLIYSFYLSVAASFVFF